MNTRSLFFLLCAAAALGSAYAQAEDEVADEAGGEVDECVKEQLDDYNLNLAIVSVFVMFITSFMGAAFPTLLAIKNHPWIVLSIKLGSFAGTGVLLSTGFVHMLLVANEQLSSPCLSEAWLSKYPAWAFLFAVLTIIFLQVLDYILAAVIDPTGAATSASGTPDASLGMPPPHPAPAAKHSSERDIEQANTDSDLPESADCNKHVVCKDQDCNGRALLPTAASIAHTKALTSLLISEISICSHSILIGITLGMTGSSEFTALFIAIVFHQLLEGVALGSSASIAGLSTKKILLLAITYAFSTPTGIAIGIGVRESLNLNSSASLLTMGILDSIAAGTLIFLALGDHMNALRSQSVWLRQQSIIVQLSCFAAFFTGAAVLLTLALWA